MPKIDLSHISDNGNKDGQNLDSKSVIPFLQTQFKYAEAARKPFEAGVFTSIMFLGGNQRHKAVYDDISNAIRRKIDIVDVSGKSYIINNIILPCYRQARSIMYDMIPEFSALPAAPGSPQDIEAAKLASHFIEWREEADNEDRKRRHEINWLLAAGEVYRMTSWDSSAGRDGYNEGDIDTRSINWFKALKDPQSSDGVWPPRYFWEFDAVHVDQIFEDFGVRVEPEDVADMQGNLDRICMNVVDGRQKQRESPKNSALVKRLYMPKSKKYKQGQVFVYAGDKLMRDPYSLQGGIWPIEKGEWLPLPGRLYAMSFIEMLLHDQRRLNVLESQLANITNKKARMDIIMTGIMEPTVKPGGSEGQQIIQLGPDNNSRYEIAKYDVDVSTAYEERDRRQEGIRIKAGTNESTMGNITTKGDVKVTELMLARESDTLNFTHISQTLHQDFSVPILETKIALSKLGYQSPRPMDISGKAGKMDSYEVRGVDLGNTKSVVFKQNPHVSPAMAVNGIKEAAMNKLLGDWQTPGQYLAALDAIEAMGLKDKSERLQAEYGSREDISPLAVQMQAKAYQLASKTLDLQNLQAEMQLQQIMNPAPVDPNVDPNMQGQPVPQGGMPVGA